jgi:hypothetical protein
VNTHEIIPLSRLGRDWSDRHPELLSIPKSLQKKLPLYSRAHGTYSMYTNYKCSCPLCREANRDRLKRYRATHPRTSELRGKS